MSSSSNDFGDLLPRSRIVKLRALMDLPGRRFTVGEFVRSYLHCCTGGLAQHLSPSDAAARLLLVRRLVELFCRMDLMGSGRIAWPQVTSYVQDMAMAVSLAGSSGGALLEGGSGSGSGSAAGSASQGGMVYRPSASLQAPENPDLPLTGVRFMRWVPELQQLLVGYNACLALHVFNHMGRLLAVLHANTPPHVPSEGSKGGGFMASAVGSSGSGSSPKGGRGGAAGSPSSPSGPNPTSFYSMVSPVKVAQSLDTEVLDGLTWTGHNAGQGSSSSSSKGGSGRRPGASPSKKRPSTAGAALQGSARRSPSPAAAAASEESYLAAAALGAPSPAVQWASGVLAQPPLALLPGERARAAVVMANSRELVQARRAALRRELGGTGGVLAQARAATLAAMAASGELGVLSSSRAAGRDAREAAAAAASEVAEALATAQESSALCGRVVAGVAARREEMAERAGLVVERETARSILSKHPGGFTLAQAERLRGMPVSSVGGGEGGNALMSIMGGGSKGALLWRKARESLFPFGVGGSSNSGEGGGDSASSSVELRHKIAERAALLDAVAAEERRKARRKARGQSEAVEGAGEGGAAAAAAAGGGGSKRAARSSSPSYMDVPVAAGPTVREATGGNPVASFAALRVSFDPGTTGKIREFGHEDKPEPRFVKSSSSSSAASAPGSASGEGGSTAAGGRLKRSSDRIARLAQPAREVTTATLLASEYCMAVPWSAAGPRGAHSSSAERDPRTWRALAPSDIVHLYAVSSDNLYITLWSTRSLGYRGVIHVLTPQDQLVWSTGANLLFGASSRGGPVQGFDVLTCSKLVQLGEVGAVWSAPPIGAAADLPSLGVLLLGDGAGTLQVWGYREGGGMGGEARVELGGGIRGSNAPRLPVLLTRLTPPATAAAPGRGGGGGGGAGATTTPTIPGIAFLKVIDDPVHARAITASSCGEVCVWDIPHLALLARVPRVGGAGVVGLTLTPSTPPLALLVDSSPSVRLVTIDPDSSALKGVGSLLDCYPLPGLPQNGLGAVECPLPHSHIVLGGRRLFMLGEKAVGGEEDSSGAREMEAEALMLPPGKRDRKGRGGGGAGLGSAVPPGFNAPGAIAYSQQLAAFIVAEGAGMAVYDGRTGRPHKKCAGLTVKPIVSMAVEAPLALWEAMSSSSSASASTSSRRSEEAAGLHAGVQAARSESERSARITASLASGRKLFVGTAGGEVLIVNVSEGRCVARAARRHSADVIALHPLGEDSLLVSASWDRSIAVHDYSAAALALEVAGLNDGSDAGGGVQGAPAPPAAALGAPCSSCPACASLRMRTLRTSWPAT